MTTVLCTALSGSAAVIFPMAVAEMPQQLFYGLQLHFAPTLLPLRPGWATRFNVLQQLFAWSIQFCSSIFTARTQEQYATAHFCFPACRNQILLILIFRIYLFIIIIF